MYTQEPIAIQGGVKKYSNTEYYWGIIPQNKMRALNEQIRKQGFSTALNDFDFGGMRFDYAESYSRSDFIHFLPVADDATILDLGSGYGNITIPLAKKFKKIIAADTSFELLEFSSLHAKEAGVSNIEYVNIAPLEYLNLPFKSKSFDAVILNGVLEWVGSGKTEEDPGFYQQALLSMLADLLKDDGVLYIAIENRLFPGWLRRDPHSKLKWTSILPRSIANWYAYRHGLKNGYRTYIYSQWGYKKLLKKAGFTNFKFYYPYTSYRAPDFIYGNDKPAKKKLFQNKYVRKIFTRRWSIFLSLLRLIRLEDVFLSSFMIMARKGEGTFTPNFIFNKNFSDKQKLFLMKITKSNNKERILLVFKDGSEEPIHQESLGVAGTTF